MLRTSPHGLHRGPHVPIGGHQVPARGQEVLRLDAPAVVHRLKAAGDAVVEGLRPRQVAVAFHHRVGAADLERFVGKERRVDAAVDHRRAGGARQAADFIAAQGVAGMDPDADDVAGRR